MTDREEPLWLSRVGASYVVTNWEPTPLDRYMHPGWTDVGPVTRDDLRVLYRLESRVLDFRRREPLEREVMGDPP